MRVNVFVAIGILVVVVGVVAWNYGLFYKDIKGVITQIDRASAVGRAEKLIDTSHREAESLGKKSYDTRVRKGILELEADREEEKLNKTKFALEQLAQTIKAAGLPKPSDVGTLTDEQKKIKITFGSREASALSAYNQLARWQTEYEQKKAVLDAKRELIVKLNERADQMISKQSELFAIIEKLKLQLTRLQADREIAKINAEIAEMGATVEGVNVGEIGKVLDTLEGEIIELTSIARVADEEAGKLSNGDVFSKPEVSSGTKAVNPLDTLWE